MQAPPEDGRMDLLPAAQVGRAQTGGQDNE